MRRVALEAKKLINTKLYQARRELLPAQDWIGALEGVRAAKRVAIEEYKAKAKAMELDIGEQTLKAAEERASHAEENILVYMTQATKEKASTVVEAKLQAFEEYKASTNFEVEIAEGLAVAYGCSSEACQAQVGKLFMGVDISLLDQDASENEAEVKANPAIVVVEFEVVVPTINALSSRPLSQPLMSPTRDHCPSCRCCQA